MILLNEAEYQRSFKIVQETRQKLSQQAEELAKKNHTPKEIKRLLDPTRAFIRGIEYEVQWYEKAKHQHLFALSDLTGIGRTLIGLRLASDMTQSDLARLLDVAPAQVCRDENDEYHGITVERAQRILAVFGARLESKVVLASPRKGTPHGRKAA